jgi:DNA-directed RNA polymerase specialized sigma24 family protein
VDEHQELAHGLEAQLRSVRDDDAVQDGFLRVVQRRASDKLANPQGYWYMASRSALHDRHRRQVAEDRAIRSWLETQGRGQEPERWSAQQLSDLRRGIDQLQGNRRQLVDLELNGLHQGRALANALGISEGATRVLRHRTYRQLRELLAG